MTVPLDVLVAESHEGVGDDARRRLEAAGHRVHRCFGEDSHGFPCSSIAVGRCPIEDGVDVVLLTRRRSATRATALEMGASCSVRAGVPLVTDGAGLLDPHVPWATSRVDDDDLVSGCESAVRIWEHTTGTVVIAGCGELLERVGIQPEQVCCRVRRAGSDLRIRMELPEPVERSTRQALSVRAVDAVRALGRRFRSVDVTVVDDAAGDWT